ncbi:CPBP family intramembrane metalloprotease domain-containing protein [Enemella dayhoffiae]|uniref:CPBP family intramembrane metalloprotease domain-containing protein n=1 Tax=Enemella dayhoffiae TaxID=2016507 RepID=A0A255GZJ8_9ACTN|nr:CPBP family intramembrane metalloprotease domain-containing protein [Enemella dayhoffiae]
MSYTPTRTNPKTLNPINPQTTPSSLSAGPITRFDGLAADAPPRSLRARIPVLFNPFLRLLLFLVITVLMAVLVVLPLILLAPPAISGNRSVMAGVQIVVTLLAYLVWVLLIERRRPPVELAPRRALGLLWGLLAGAVVFAVVFAVIVALGAYQIEGTNSPDWGEWWRMVLAVGAGAGIAEELLFRGVLYRITEELLGTWGAVVVSGLVFGIVHISNPDATWWGAIAIGLEAGLLLGVLYAWSRSLWLMIGFHAAWNITQGPLLGVIVSGTGEVDGLVKVTPQGSDLISGGRFGAEASVVAVLLLVALAVALGVRLARTGGVVQPMWVRRSRQKRAIASGSAGGGSGVAEGVGKGVGEQDSALDGQHRPGDPGGLVAGQEQQRIRDV